MKEGEENVILSTNVLFGVQSILKKDNGLTGMYYDYAMAAPLMAGVTEKEQSDILILGMGTGTFATQCSRYFDRVRLDGVEIDEKITKLARQYFELPENIPVTTYDGRAYLNAIDKTYDVILVDAFQDITIPFQMSSAEFFTLVKKHLNKDGVMVVNLNMRGTEEGSINQYLSDTISSVFEQVYTIDVPGCTNRILYAFGPTDALSVFHSGIAKIKDDALHTLMGTIAQNIQRYHAGQIDANDGAASVTNDNDTSDKNKTGSIMTDDKAPVELLGMKVIDELIQDEVRYYRDIYEREGIKGLLP